MSTSMSTTTPATDSMSTSTTEPETGSESESGSTGSTGGSSESSGSGGSSGSGSGGGAGDFVINFTGYMPHAGQDMYLKVFSEDDSTEIAEQTAVTEDAFTITIPGIIEDGVNYNVRWWVDFNDSGTCEPPGTDHAWELEGQAGTASGLTIDDEHDTDFTDVCSFWKR
jgi:hypothetical protein